MGKLMEEFEDEFSEKSKSQLKREMSALQDVGMALTKLSPEKLSTIPLSEKLRDAILEAPNIKKNSSIRRHMQFIGKLMRADDHEKIVAAFENMKESERNEARRFHQLEHWRNELIQGNKEILATFLEQYPHTDRQQLNQLIRASQKEINQNKPQGSAKKLFQFIRQAIASE